MGSGWSIQKAPAPSASFSEFEGVSCATTTACTAVGVADNTSFAEHWNGITWSLDNNAPMVINGGFLAVSCASPTACMVVGSAEVSLGSVGTLAVYWDGTNWTTLNTPDPSGASNSYLDAVSCTSGTSCTAAGYYIRAQTGDEAPLIERWNGTRWAMQFPPSPAGAQLTQLNGVACASVAVCTAVGYSQQNGTAPLTTYAVVKDFSTWKLQATPNPNGATSSVFSGVSCPSAKACTAVGHTNVGAGTLAERWDGTSWTIQTTPTSPSGGLTGVACASLTTCTAVGSSASNFPLAEHWTGTSWMPQSVPNPSGATSSRFNAVSCPSTTACTAVGTSNGGGSKPLLVEHWT